MTRDDDMPQATRRRFLIEAATLAGTPRSPIKHIVFIVKDMDESFASGLYGALAGRPMVDTPDAAAFGDNPLAPKSAGLLG